MKIRQHYYMLSLTAKLQNMLFEQLETDFRPTFMNKLTESPITF